MNAQHRSTRRHALAQMLAGAGALAFAGATRADTYPTRQVRLIVPFPAGGPVDTVGRAIAQQLPAQWGGQQAFVDNRAGAGGVVGAELASHAAPDGYTLFLCSIHHAVMPALRPKLGYDIERSFTPVAFGARFPIILVVNPSLPARNVRELIALDKADPGKLSFGSSGNGGGTHLAGELFNMKAGTKLQHIPYKGSAPAMADLLGGQVQMMFADGPTALPQIRAGKVRALAVADEQRSALVPDIPTMAEGGLPGYQAYSWAAVVAPAGTPKDVVARLNTDISRALQQPEVKQRLYDAGAEAASGTPEQFAAFLHAEIAKWGDVVRTAHIQAD